ncbi:Domain of uncharacterised function (DUF2825) [Klebsiella pneumoniae]|nr:Domain of uncharacterised function (DUF2825) [Klebsiella pneumoniae]
MPRQSDGLSPLARGTPNIIQGINNYRRFIPAGSGNTQRSQTPEMEIPVYPRWRGEHPCSVELKPGLIGLSPLARGTRRRRKFLLPEARFIPAGAGNTCPVRQSSTIISVYPRWRGEHNSRLQTLTDSGGLSPLARGTRVNNFSTVGIDWFIPAGAGNTSLLGIIFVAPPGLSPLARGTPPADRFSLTDNRFIPAGAGNTWNDGPVSV